MRKKRSNYLSVLEPLKNIFEIKSFYKNRGIEYKYCQFTLASSRAMSIALSKHLDRVNIRKLYNDKEVESYIGYIENNEIVLFTCNCAVG